MIKSEEKPDNFEDYGKELQDLSEGKFAKCVIQGKCMKTFFRTGKDYLILAPIKNAKPCTPEEEMLIRRHTKEPDKKKRNSSSSEDRLTIKRRDIVLFKYGDTDEYHLLRVMHIWGTLLLLRGDASYGRYERATVSDVAGVAVKGTWNGGCNFKTSSIMWKLISKIWTASYRLRLGFIKAFKLVPAMLLIGLLMFPSSCAENNAVFVKNGQFIKNEKPYYFVGANFWYGALLGSEGEGGDRERLCRELDSLHNIGLDNLRILACGEGREGLVDKIAPIFQEEPGKYDENLLEGLDYLLTEMHKRNMTAVLYLNNSWEWSGGISQYLEWAGYGTALIPAVDGYSAYEDYVGNFQKSDSAKAMFFDHIKFMVSRRNSISGIEYKNDPTIFSWQICNEPRPFGKENKENFYHWIEDCANLIKEIDPNHMVSTGSEGLYGCQVDIDLWKRIGELENIDYLNIHIWPSIWGWVDRENTSATMDSTIKYSNEYLSGHLRIAEEINKPLVVEEFGFPRDGFKYDTDTPVTLRNIYYQSIFDSLFFSANKNGSFAGCNFWGWGGDVIPQHLTWEIGDTYTGDPAQEEQGLFSVFASDTSTISIIKNNIDKINSIKR